MSEIQESTPAYLNVVPPVGPPIGIYDYLRAIEHCGLPRTQRDVLRLLMTWLNAESWRLFPSVSRMAKAMGADRRTVQRTLNKLRSIGVISDVRAHRSGTNEMQLNFDRLKALAEAELAKTGERLATTPSNGTYVPTGGTTPPPLCSDAAQTNQPTIHKTTTSTAVHAKVESLLGNRCDLLSHPNATPERLAYIARNAHRKRSPTGWAIDAIERGYETKGKLTPERRKALQLADRVKKIRKRHAETAQDSEFEEMA